MTVRDCVIGIMFVVCLIAACSLFLPPASVTSAQPVEPDAGPCLCPERATNIQLLGELEACETAIKKADRTLPPRKIVRVEVDGKPKICGGEGPTIAPIKTTQCLPNMTCLDPTAEMTLVKNMAAYDAWVKKTQECERESLKQGK